MQHEAAHWAAGERDSSQMAETRPRLGAKPEQPGPQGLAQGDQRLTLFSLARVAARRSSASSRVERSMPSGTLNPSTLATFETNGLLAPANYSTAAAMASSLT